MWQRPSPAPVLPLFPSSLFPDFRSRAVALVVTVLAGTCVYFEWRGPRPGDFSKLDSQVDRIQALEREIVVDVVFTRIGDKRSTQVRENLEELGQSVIGFKRTLERDYSNVVVGAADLLTDLHTTVDAQARSVSSLVASLEFLLERLNRLPEMVSGLQRTEPEIWDDPELTSALSSIQRDLWVSASRNAASVDRWFEEDLERMRIIRDLASPEKAAVIDKLVEFCESLTTRVRLIDIGLHEIESLPVGHTMGGLREFCLADYSRRLDTAARWRWVLVGGLVAVIATLVFRILIMAKSSQLDQTAAELLKAQLHSKDEQVEDLEARLEDERLRAERAEASFRRSRSQEQAALRLKKEFMSFLDVRVKSRARGLLTALTEDDATEEHRMAAPLDAQALHDTLCDLFDMEGIRSGSIEVAEAPCSLDEILGLVEDYGRHLARAKAISLSVHRSEETPDRIYTDPERLRRILQNLLEHAIVSTDTGQVELSVEQAVGNAGKLQFTVLDTGRGMNSDRVDFLFTPPQEGERIEDRSETMATPGLSIVPTLVRLMDGAFHVDSVVGRGTTVAFEVGIVGSQSREASVNQPLSETHTRSALESRVASVSPSSNSRGKPNLARPLAGRRVLVVEDGEDNRRLMEYVLSRAGAAVEMAENGALACERVMSEFDRGEAFDVILMDMNMPVMDGYEATESLRANGYDRPIVALTASALPENRDRCFEVGCDEFLTKPVDAKVFAHLLEEIALEHVGLAQSTGDESSLSGPPSLESFHAKSERLASSEPEAEPLFSEYASDTDMTELIELFVQDLKSDIRRVNAALSEGDLESLGVLAHQLKGSAGSYGFPQLTEQADRLETCVRTSADPGKLEREVADFVSLCRRVSA